MPGTSSSSLDAFPDVYSLDIREDHAIVVHRKNKVYYKTIVARSLGLALLEKMMGDSLCLIK